MNIAKKRRLDHPKIFRHYQGWHFVSNDKTCTPKNGNIKKIPHMWDTESLGVYKYYHSFFDSTLFLLCCRQHYVRPWLCLRHTQMDIVGSTPNRPIGLFSENPVYGRHQSSWPMLIEQWNLFFPTSRILDWFSLRARVSENQAMFVE